MWAEEGQRSDTGGPRKQVTDQGHQRQGPELQGTLETRLGARRSTTERQEDQRQRGNLRLGGLQGPYEVQAKETRKHELVPHREHCVLLRLFLRARPPLPRIFFLWLLDLMATTPF